MDAIFWRQMWRKQCESTRFFMGFAATEGLVITLLMAALVGALR